MNRVQIINQALQTAQDLLLQEIQNQIITQREKRFLSYLFSEIRKIKFGVMLYGQKKEGKS